MDFDKKEFHQSPPVWGLAVVYLLFFIATQIANDLMTSGLRNQNL